MRRLRATDPNANIERDSFTTNEHRTTHHARLPGDTAAARSFLAVCSRRRNITGVASRKERQRYGLAETMDITGQHPGCAMSSRASIDSP